jgi:hypothetical protein
MTGSNPGGHGRFPVFCEGRPHVAEGVAGQRPLGRGGRIPTNDPGKPDPAHLMTAVLGARNAGFRSARTSGGGERVEKDTAPMRSNDRWP